MKKLLLILIIFSFFTFKIFAKTGFEFNIYGGFGAGILMTPEKNPPKGYRGTAFELNLGIQAGLLLDFKNNSGISILVDFVPVTFWHVYYDAKRNRLAEDYFMSVGLMPKFNIGQNFSLGISVGAKIPYESSIKVYPIYAKLSINYVYGGGNISSAAIGPYIGCDFGKDRSSYVIHVGVEFIKKFGSRIDDVGK